MAENEQNDSNDYGSVISDLTCRHAEISRRIAALHGEAAQINKALECLNALQPGSANPGGKRTTQIVDFVTRSGQWVTHGQIVLGLLPRDGRAGAFPRERHVIRTQVGQLVNRGLLRQVGALIGLPHWEEPVPQAPLQPGLVSARNGRAANIRSVLRDAGRALHIKDVCAELLRRGLDADERCVVSAMESIRVRGGGIVKVAPGMYEMTSVTEPVSTVPA